MYQPFPREKFERTGRDLWFQELAEHIRPQAESQPYVTDLAWFKQFQPTPKFPTLQSVDTDIYDLVGDDLRDKANAFIGAQRGVLVA